MRERSLDSRGYFNLLSKTALQSGLRRCLLRSRQSVIAVRSGMNSLQRRKTSGLQALRCANVPSSAWPVVQNPMTPATTKATRKPMIVLTAASSLWIGLLPSIAASANKSRQSDLNLCETCPIFAKHAQTWSRSRFRASNRPKSLLPQQIWKNLEGFIGLT